jgi:ABC-type multidrug transport system fused ATPase/permease subunit
MIDLVQQHELSITNLLLVVALIGVVNIVKTIFNSHSVFQNDRLGLLMQVSAKSLIFNKVMKYSLMKNPEHDSGKVHQYLTEDANTFSDAMWAFDSGVTTPIKVILGFAILYTIAGWPVLLAVVVFVVQVLIGNKLLKVINKFEDKH